MTLFGQTLRSTAYDLADAFKVNELYQQTGSLLLHCPRAHASRLRFAVDSVGVALYSASTNATLSDTATCHDCLRHTCRSSYS